MTRATVGVCSTYPANLYDMYEAPRLRTCTRHATTEFVFSFKFKLVSIMRPIRNQNPMDYQVYHLE